MPGICLFEHGKSHDKLKLLQLRYKRRRERICRHRNNQPTVIANKDFQQFEVINRQKHTLIVRQALYV